MKDFIKGIFFVSLVLPIIEGISSIINQFSEFICMKIASKTYQLQKLVKEDQEQSEKEICTNVVGFQMPSTIDGEEDE